IPAASMGHLFKFYQLFSTLSPLVFTGRPYRGHYHTATSASPQATSMIECCLVNTVDAQISPAQPKASTLSQGLPWASLLLAKARAMQPELWQWMEGQTLLEASAVQIRRMRPMGGLPRPSCAT